MVIRYRKRKELGITEQDILLLSVGELNENKNHVTVIKALRELVKLGNTNIKYVIVGKGKLEKNMKQMISDCNLEKQVFMPGFQTDVMSWYDAADIFVFPSFREGLSVALMEAMASGLPVVCSNIRGNTDLINQDSGELFIPYDLEGCISAISIVIAKDSQFYRKNNIRNVKKFDKKHVTKLIEKIYEGLQ